LLRTAPCRSAAVADSANGHRRVSTSHPGARGCRRPFGSFVQATFSRGHVEGKNLRLKRYGKEQNLPDHAALHAVFRSNPGCHVRSRSLHCVRRITQEFRWSPTADPVAVRLRPRVSPIRGQHHWCECDSGPSIHGKRIALLRECFLRCRNGLIAGEFMGGSWAGALCAWTLLTPRRFLCQPTCRCSRRRTT